jgi:hypothetical protein
MHPDIPCFDFLLPNGKMNSEKPQGTVIILKYRASKPLHPNQGVMGNYKYYSFIEEISTNSLFFIMIFLAFNKSLIFANVIP